MGISRELIAHSHDVFISYSSHDGDWVRNWLLPRLEEVSLCVCIDFRDFDIGVPSLVNIERAVEQSCKTLLVLTPNWMKSEWTTFESLLVQIEDPAGLRGRLLPLMLKHCEPPKRIAMLTYADFTLPERWESELQRIVNSFDKGISRGQWVLRLRATIEEVDLQKAQAVVTELQRLSGDSLLRLQRIESGSVVLVLEGSQDGFERLESLFRTGQLPEVLGIEIQDMRWQPQDTPEARSEARGAASPRDTGASAVAPEIALTPSMRDFFISYNSADRPWAEWIAWQLEESGYTTVLQAWDFQPGTNFVLEMQRALSDAERTIAVLSPEYLSALYTQPEWAAAFAQDPTSQQSKLLPVHIRECNLEGMLRSIVHIDLVDLDEAAAKVALLADIQRARAKPATPPGFPVATPRAVPEQPRFPASGCKF